MTYVKTSLWHIKESILIVIGILFKPSYNHYLLLWEGVKKFGIFWELLDKKSCFQGQKQWPPKFHIKLRNPGPPPYLGNIPKKYHL